VPAIDDRAGVDRHDLAAADTPRTGHAVDDLVVDRDAQRVPKGASRPARRRTKAPPRCVDHLLGQRVERHGGHARLDLR
jgi:hypothetical protein